MMEDLLRLINFCNLKKSLSEVRSEYEEKRPVLASIMKKKSKNKAKRQEKMSFGVKKGKRKFNPKFKNQPHMCDNYVPQ
jgi:hypothetical protein